MTNSSKETSNWLKEEPEGATEEATVVATSEAAHPEEAASEEGSRAEEVTTLIGEALEAVAASAQISRYA